MSKKNKLIHNLEQTYVRLSPSPLQGVGVFAIRDIPKGVNPFQMANKMNYRSIKCTKSELSHLHPSVKKMIHDFIEPDGNSYHIPENGLNSLDVSFYLNHGDDNNLAIIENGDNDDYMSFITLRPIKKGEELLIDYKDYKD